MLKIGAVFAAVGYLLVIGALVLEFTVFHPAIESFFATHTAHSIAGGGADRATATALATIHTLPSTLLWLTLGRIAHVLVGIFVALAAIIRALALMPHRLRYEMEPTQYASPRPRPFAGLGMPAAGSGSPSDPGGSLAIVPAPSPPRNVRSASLLDVPGRSLAGGSDHAPGPAGRSPLHDDTASRLASTGPRRWLVRAG